MWRSKIAKSFFLLGDRALDKKLKELNSKIAKRVVRQATRSGMKIFQGVVKSAAPRGSTGNLAKSIKVRSGKRSRRHFSMVVQLGEGNFKGETWYGAAVEYGTSKMAPTGFMRKSFDSTHEQVRKHAMSEIAKGIEREAK